MRICVVVMGYVKLVVETCLSDEVPVTCVDRTTRRSRC